MCGRVRRAWARRRALPGIFLAAGLAALLPARASADADFQILPVGEGFADATRRPPVGGNDAPTLGAQRLAAVQYAADQWGALLDSKVPVVVQVRFANLGCEDDAVVLAHAGTVKMVRAIERPGVDPMLWFPSALANRLAGVDLSPGEPDILMEINSAVDGSCRTSAGGWYYGLDGASAGTVDLVETVMHELAHGLGFSSSIDPETGEAVLPAGADTFSSRIVEQRSGRPWVSLSAADRRFTTRSPRSLVFEGARTRRRAKSGLSSGADALGRPWLYTNLPVDRGSSVSHFDPLARPDLLMEPFARRVPTHDVDLTVSVLADLGWAGWCGDGTLDPGEQCDDGLSGNGEGARCSPTCTRTSCGDGKLDPGEQCDDGAANGDRTPNACRESCEKPSCGDGVVDRGESCDGSDGCTSTCTRGVDERATASLQTDAGAGGERAPLPALRRETGGCSLGHGDQDAAGWSWLLLLGILARRPRRRAGRIASRLARSHLPR